MKAPWPTIQCAMFLVATLPLTSATVFAATDRQVRTFALPAGRAIALEITIGHVTIEGSPRDDVSIEIVRTAPAAEGLTRIPIEFIESETELRIRGVQLESLTDPAYRTDVTLRVPHAAALRDIRVMEGQITLTALRGAITADIRRGSITGAGIEGMVRLESGIGSVVLDGARLSPHGLLRLRAFNGDVRLTLAERPRDARILALALNGTIKSSIPLTMKDTWGPRWGETTLGKGDPVISIDVITGRIEITAPPV